MHAGAIVERYRLWHHRRNHVLFFGNILDNILVTLNGIGSINQGIKSNVNLALTGSRYFMVMSIADYAEIIRKYINAFVSVFHEGVAWRPAHVPPHAPKPIAPTVNQPRCSARCAGA